MSRIISSISMLKVAPSITTHYRDYDASLITVNGIALVGDQDDNRIEFALSVRPDQSHWVDLVNVGKDARKIMCSNRLDNTDMEYKINKMAKRYIPELHAQLMKQIALDRSGLH